MNSKPHVLLLNEGKVFCFFFKFTWRRLYTGKAYVNHSHFAVSLCFLSQVILASGYYAAFKVTLVAKALEGVYDGAVHITTDYEVCVLWDLIALGMTLLAQVWC